MSTPASTLDLELLRTFIAVVDNHSFAEAGLHLARTQSSVTQHMQRLEQRIGVSLFQKQGRQKQLTEPGRQLLRHARQMLSQRRCAELPARKQPERGVAQRLAPR